MSDDQIANLIMESGSEFSETEPSDDFDESDPDDLMADSGSSGSDVEPEWSSTHHGRRNQPLGMIHFSGNPPGPTQYSGHLTETTPPLTVFLLCFSDIVPLVVTETNRYYEQYTDKNPPNTNPEPNVTENEMRIFIALILQMPTHQPPDITTSWSTSPQNSNILNSGHGGTPDYNWRT